VTRSTDDTNTELISTFRSKTAIVPAIMDSAIPLGLSESEFALRIALLREAARDSSPISGTTHDFYRYPARFSPKFAAAGIELFSDPGAVVLDPFMGGGTSIIEATRLGRSAIGNDINALAVFVTQVKTTPLSNRQVTTLRTWAELVVPSLRFNQPLGNDWRPPDGIRNLHLPRARPIKKLIALALSTLSDLPDDATRRFARCALLMSGQWALNGRKTAASCERYRQRLCASVHTMLDGLAQYERSLQKDLTGKIRLICGDVADLNSTQLVAEAGKADLVLTSPPYPNIHILYHRWQVDGRKETQAPYWISNTRDGQGSAYYNLGDRQKLNAEDYFERLAVSFKSIRNAMKDGGILLQMVSFGQPKRDLRRYLASMSAAGFTEVLMPAGPGGGRRRIWRSVPRRAWHATTRGATASSREVVLLHIAS
jgi:DNA modification methylase